MGPPRELSGSGISEYQEIDSRRPIIVLWRAGLRISEALALAESDLDPARGAILVRRGKAAAPRGRHGPVGVGATRAVAATALRASGRRAVLHHPRRDPRTAMVGTGRARAATTEGTAWQSN